MSEKKERWPLNMINRNDIDKNILNVLPPPIEVIEQFITMTVFKYEYGSEVDEFGDREIVDTEHSYKAKVKVHIITFFEWINALYNLNSNGVLEIHSYTKEFIPYGPCDTYVWQYFDQIEGNILTNGYKSRNEDKVRIYVYFINEFNYFAILRLLSHHDQVANIKHDV